MAHVIMKDGKSKICPKWSKIGPRLETRDELIQIKSRLVCCSLPSCLGEVSLLLDQTFS